MRKKFIILLIAVALIIAIIPIIINNNNKKYNYEVEKLGEQNYFLLMENNKYGVIDRAGNIVIDPNFDVVEMPNPSKDIFICKSNYNEDKNEYNVEVFNKNREQILKQYNMVEAISLNNVENNGFYEKSVLKYKSDGLYGLIDLSGNKITKAIYESIEGFEYNEGLLLTKKSGKYGIININGAVVVKNKYDEILSDTYYEASIGYKKSGYIVGKKSDDGMRYGYINSDRKELLKNEFNEVQRITEKKDSIYLIASKNGKKGIYNENKNIIKHNYEEIEYDAQNDRLILKEASKLGVAKFDGSMIVPFEYEYIFFAGTYINAVKSDGIDIFDADGNRNKDAEYVSRRNYANNNYDVVSTVNGEYKIIDKSNGKVVENGYTYISYLYDKYFIAQKNEVFGIIDGEGNTIIDHKYKSIQPNSDYNIVQLVDKNDNRALLNNKLEEIVSLDNYNIVLLDNLIKITSKESVQYVNNNGEIITNKEAYKNNKLFAYCEKNKWGYKSKNDEIVVEAKYDKVTEFNEYGFAGIKINEEWGVIDENGNVIKEPIYKFEDEPEFIKEYYKVDLGDENPYYTNLN